MIRPRHLASLVPLLALAPTSLLALVKFNDGRDEIFVTGRVGFGYDSNLSASANGDGDSSWSSALELEYKRKAGMLGVNADAGIDFVSYSEQSDFNYANPHARLELTKDAGRATGSITAAVAREERADAAINFRTTSWEYDLGLNVKYPVIERYTLSGNVGWNHRDFEDNTALVDLKTYTAGADIYYVYTSQRDILGGYRFRATETTAGTKNYDHAFTIGSTGRVLPKLNGTVRFGYQHREARPLNRPVEQFDGVMAAATSTWTVSKRLNLTGQISSDFNTLATDVSIENQAIGLDVQYVLAARYSLFGGIGAGHTRFLGLPGNNREDDYVTGNIGFAYTHSDHFKLTLAYGFFQNWSNLAFSDYRRNTISLNISSRW